MRKAKIKTIDVSTKQWWDKYNGNTYFSAQITINFGTKSAERVYMPFQYGYGSYHHETFSELIKKGFIKDAEKFSNGTTESYFNYYQRKGIIYRHYNTPNCLKRDVVAFGAK